MIKSFHFIVASLLITVAMHAQPSSDPSFSSSEPTLQTSMSEDSISETVDSLSTDSFSYDEEDTGVYQALKTKFIEGNPLFMSLVALALVLGLAFCIERIIYLAVAEIDNRKFLSDLEAKILSGDMEGARQQCLNTRGPVASICYQGLLRADMGSQEIERSIASYGALQAANLEQGCSWIRLFIAMAPSLGFLGTVIGIVMAFDQIQQVGDIGPTIVAAGMKVALITTIFGIIVALVLQLFYNYILNRIDALTEQMEEAGITLLDILNKQRQER